MQVEVGQEFPLFPEQESKIGVCNHLSVHDNSTDLWLPMEIYTSSLAPVTELEVSLFPEPYYAYQIDDRDYDPEARMAKILRSYTNIFRHSNYYSASRAYSLSHHMGINAIFDLSTFCDDDDYIQYYYPKIDPKTTSVYTQFNDPIRNALSKLRFRIFSPDDNIDVNSDSAFGFDNGRGEYVETEEKQESQTTLTEVLTNIQKIIGSNTSSTEVDSVVEEVAWFCEFYPTDRGPLATKLTGNPLVDRFIKKGLFFGLPEGDPLFSRLNGQFIYGSPSEQQGTSIIPSVFRRAFDTDNKSGGGLG